jgi:hypothetical protein
MIEWSPALIERTLHYAAHTDDGADWAAALDDLDAEIVRLRASGSRWKPICWQMGISRATAHRRFRAALKKIVDRLNDR